MIKKIVFGFFIFLLIFGALVGSTQASEKKTQAVIFYGQGCPHCGKALEFLHEKQDEYSGLKVKEFEIYFARENVETFNDLATVYNGSAEAVPTIFIDQEMLVGFGPQVQEAVEEKLKYCQNHTCVEPLSRLEKTKKGGMSFITPEQREEINKRAEQIKRTTDIRKEERIKQQESSEIKNINKEKVTLPAVISAAAVDAINPCAFAVLVILLSTILASDNKKRALWAGLAFTCSIYISYFLMGLGLYSALATSGLTHTFYVVVAVLAIFIGLFNLKDFIWPERWFVMEVPMSWRPKMKSLIRGVTSVPGAFLIGFVISLFLLPCTSGPYIVILGLLGKMATKNYAVGLLAVYNFIFILPMILITLAIYFGLTTTEKAEAWRKEKIKWLHLAAGIIILLLGIGMLVSLALGYL